MRWRNPWYNPSLPHHLPDGFRNPEATGSHQAGAVTRWRRERKAQKLPHPPSGGYLSFVNQWWQKTDIAGSDDRVWWLGHACLLLRLSGNYLLIDPVFSHRASPFSFAGPARKVPNALDLAALPGLDAVLVSHNHYDHLDSKTVRQIVRRFPDVHFFVPLGLKPWFQRRGIRRVTQLDWWQNTSLNGITLTAVPAHHWSMRTLWDRNRSLWCGWGVKSAGVNFWFSGDSGYTTSLAEIPRRLGPFDAVALPIGAYEPRWFMAGSHMDPQQAVRLWQETGRPLAIPIHWGVFELSDESLDTPPQVLLEALAQAGEMAGNFSPLKIGQGLSLIKK